MIKKKSARNNQKPSIFRVYTSCWVQRFTKRAGTPTTLLQISYTIIRNCWCFTAVRSRIFVCLDLGANLAWHPLPSFPVRGCEMFIVPPPVSLEDLAKQRPWRFSIFCGEKTRLSSSEQTVRCPVSVCPSPAPKSRGLLAAFLSPVPAAL